MNTKDTTAKKNNLIPKCGPGYLKILWIMPEEERAEYVKQLKMKKRKDK